MNANLTIKRLLGRAVRSPQCSPRKLILLYHSVGTGPWALGQAQFRAQIGWLAEVALITTLADLLDACSGSSIQIALSFDDGYASAYEIVRPILRAFGVVATLFVNTGRIAELVRAPSDPTLGHYPQESFLSWRDIAELAGAGWTIGSHGVDHLDLTRASPARVHEQVYASKAAIEARLGTPCDYFSYTWGRHDTRVRRAVAQAGYRYALGGEHGPIRGGGDPFRLARINVANDYTLEDFKAIVRGDWDYLAWVHRTRHDWRSALRSRGRVA
jgi:peptidoglycan/xylan/chitin deacetylase (PgdA/CDA1 family)